MKTLFSNIWAFIRQPLPAALLGVLVVSVAALIFFTGGSDLSNFDVESVERHTVTQEVNVSGRVEPADELDLSVERGGRIVLAPVKIGQRVSRGTLLVSVTSGTLAAQRIDAAASLEREQIKLSQLKVNGAGSQTGTALQNARNNLDTILTNGYSEIDTALTLYVDTLYENPRTSPSFGTRVTTSEGTLVIEGTSSDALTFNRNRREVQKDMDSWKMFIDSANSDEERFVAVNTGYEALSEVDRLSLSLSQYLARRSAESTAERAIFEELRADVAAMRGTVTQVRSQISTAEQALRTAQVGIAPDEVRLQELAVEQARARLASIDAQIAEGSIYSPIAGTVTRQDARVGEFLSPATPVVTIASDAEFEIEAFVPEADISKISVGDSAELTLDAFESDDIFNAEVIFIDPAETISEGIATFKITLHFAQAEDTQEVLPGMTADIDIFTGRADDVIAVPQRAISERDGDTYARVVRGEDVYEVKVETGLKGTDGLTEITKGLSEGDIIVVFERG